MRVLVLGVVDAEEGAEVAAAEDQTWMTLHVISAARRVISREAAPKIPLRT